MREAKQWESSPEKIVPSSYDKMALSFPEQGEAHGGKGNYGCFRKQLEAKVIAKIC